MSRIARCNCVGCNNIGTVPMNLDRRGGRLAYLCSMHAERLESYYAENDTFHGKDKVSKDTFGVEFETTFSTLKARHEIIANGYLPTSDCTVDVEYKSPILKGLNSLSKQCVTWDRLIERGELRIGAGCGTHFHYGNEEWINSETIQYIRRFYHSLFIPLCEAMEQHSEANVELWGRDFSNHTSEGMRAGNYYHTIEAGCEPMAHANFINVQHSCTIEFRIAKYKNATQFMRMARLVKAIGNCIVENFVKHFNDTDYDRKRYPEQRLYRLHKAQVTGAKIAKLYLKAINQ